MPKIRSEMLRCVVGEGEKWGWGAGGGQVCDKNSDWCHKAKAMGMPDGRKASARLAQVLRALAFRWEMTQIALVGWLPIGMRGYAVLQRLIMSQLRWA
eukprot:COSAG05_NODE_82_length_20915_cov_5.306399_10_plen_98_part_00